MKRVTNTGHHHEAFTPKAQKSAGRTRRTILFFVLSVLLLNTLPAWGDVEINKTNFPDSVFRKILMEFHTQGSNIITDDVIKQTEVLNLDTLAVLARHYGIPPENVYDLKGIEFFVYLKKLKASGPQRGNLDLSNNKLLESLDLDVFFYDIDLSNNTNLSSLTIRGLSVDAYKTPASLNIGNCKQLKSLYVRDMYLDELSLPTKNLDALTITNVKLVTPIDLVKEGISINDYVGCENTNAISGAISLDGYNGDYLKLVNCSELTSVEVLRAEHLESLKCSDCKTLNSVTIDNCPNMEVINLTNSPVSDFEITNSPNVFFLYAKNTRMSIDQPDLYNLKYLYCNGTTSKSFHCNNYKKLVWLECDLYEDWDLRHLSNSLTSVYVGNIEGVHDINLAGCSKLESFDFYPSIDYKQSRCANLNLSDCSSLKSLKTKGLSSLDVTNCKRLETISVRSGDITSLDVSNLPRLEELNCAQNKLTSLKISNCRNLRSLYCSNNMLEELEFPPSVDFNNNFLDIIDCSFNKLKSLNLKLCTKLKKLYCDNNMLEELDVSGNTWLYALYCNNNRLSALELHQEPIALDCSNNQLTTLTVNVYNFLYCADNPLWVINFLDAKSLFKFDISNTVNPILNNFSFANNKTNCVYNCANNSLAAKTMDAHIDNLPVLENSYTTYVPNTQPEFIVMDYRKDVGKLNLCTSAQCKRATEKGWNVVAIDEQGNHVLFQGNDDEAGINERGAGHVPAKTTATFTIDGKRIDDQQPGLNIIRMSDGKVRKVMVK